MFYSDSGGYYRYYKALIEQVLRAADDIVIHYLTDDPDDQVLSMESDRFKPYYIDSNRMIVLFMKLECSVMVTTVPDLGNYHLKRSIVKPDVEYIYISHGMGSVNYGLRKGSFDHFDTLFCMGRHMIREVREMEQMYSLPEKRLIEFGYPLLDELIAQTAGMPEPGNDPAQVIIAPSYQDDNILESCFEEMAESLLLGGYHVILRPHPYWIKHNPGEAERIARQYGGRNFTLDMDFADASRVFGSDVLITDWSTVAMDFSFSTLRPCIFINTKTKVRNPDYQKYKNRPIDFTLRTRIGAELEKQDVGAKIVSTVEELIEKRAAYRTQIAEIRQETIFNLGQSAAVGAEYLVHRIKGEGTLR